MKSLKVFECVLSTISCLFFVSGCHPGPNSHPKDVRVEHDGLVTDGRPQLELHQRRSELWLDDGKPESLLFESRRIGRWFLAWTRSGPGPDEAGQARQRGRDKRERLQPQQSSSCKLHPYFRFLSHFWNISVVCIRISASLNLAWTMNKLLIIKPLWNNIYNVGWKFLIHSADQLLTESLHSNWHKTSIPPRNILLSSIKIFFYDNNHIFAQNCLQQNATNLI